MIALHFYGRRYSHPGDFMNEKKSTLLYYIGAIATTLIALGLHLVLSRYVGDEFPFIFFILSVLINAWHGGFGPALLSALLGGLASFYFILSAEYPPGVWMVTADCIGLIVFSVVTGGIALLGGEMQRVRKAALASIESERRQHQELLIRIRAEETLRATEERLRMFIENAPMPIAMLDREMRYVIVSRNWMTSYGLENSNLIGRSHYELFPDIPTRWKVIHQEALAGKTLRSDEDSYERNDGSTQWLRWEVRPWYDAVGAIGGILIYADDITALKEGSAALRKSEKEKRLLLESTAEAIYGIDTEGNCTFCNPAGLRILGYDSPTNVLGKNMHELCHHTYEDGRSHPRIECQIYKAFCKGEGAHDSNDIFWRADGTPIHVEYWSYPIHDEGRITGAVVAFIDITERLNLEAQLIQAQKMECVGQLAGGIAHDFNNLLTVINGHSQLLIDRAHPDEKVRRGLELIYRTGERAAGLTRQLLDFSRRQVLEPKTLDLNVVARDMDKLLRRLIREDIILKTALHPSLWHMTADPGKIEQVIMNLVVNARDAMANIGTLTIETDNVELSAAYCRTHAEAQPGEFVRLSISDTGTGMSPETRKRIFEPFFTTKGPGKGTGLGLATVYGIVKQSGGMIEVYSAPGKGTTFKVYFPREKDAALSSATSADARTEVRGHETVLLVEDEDGVRDLIQELLQENGYTVISARNGREALHSFLTASRPIDLLITDVVMPEMGGPELSRKLREIRPSLRVLFTSGYADNAVVNNGSIDPDAHFLQKPFSPSTLTLKVRDALDSAPSELRWPEHKASA